MANYVNESVKQQNKTNPKIPQKIAGVIKTTQQKFDK